MRPDLNLGRRLESSVDDFFGIMEEDQLPPLPSPPSAFEMPPVWTEYDPSSDLCGQKTFGIDADSVTSQESTTSHPKLLSSVSSQASTEMGSDSSTLSASLSPHGIPERFRSESLQIFPMSAHIGMWKRQVMLEPRPKPKWLERWAVLPPQPARLRDLDFTYTTIAGQGPVFSI
ncbi:unnamed protein product [Tilletia controversa]|nr:unnamed protein product [Tilletia controversa]